MYMFEIRIAYDHLSELNLTHEYIHVSAIKKTAYHSHVGGGRSIQLIMVMSVHSEKIL